MSTEASEKARQGPAGRYDYENQVKRLIELEQEQLSLKSSLQSSKSSLLSTVLVVTSAWAHGRTTVTPKILERLTQAIAEISAAGLSDRQRH